MRTGPMLIIAWALVACEERQTQAPAPVPLPVGSSANAGQGSGAAPDAQSTGFDEALLGSIPAGTLGGQVLDAQRRPARDVVVYVKRGAGSGKRGAGSALMDQQNKTFLPHVLPVVVGTRVDFRNSDPVLHNVYSRVAAKTFDLGMFDKSKSKSVTFDAVGRIDVFCSIHTNMHAVILVLANADFAVTDARGYFAIPDLAPGSYTIAIWDEVATERELTVEVAANRAAVIKHELVTE